MSSRRIHLWTGFVILALMLWLFGPAMLGRQSFVFRDAAHYYAPLFEWNVAQWRSGNIPIWNPLEYLGLPTLGENTASVFYPAQLLLLAPIDFIWAYNLYVVLHVALAAFGAWRLARRFGLEPGAAGYGALVYAFSGAVVFQYCNVVFLIGAAWLPLALDAVDRLLERGNARRAMWLATCLAMMVLGGDPQMAYHVGLAGGLYAVILSRCRREEGAPGDVGSAARTTPAPHAQTLPQVSTVRIADPTSAIVGPSFVRRGAWLVAAGLIAAGLAAVQILPSWELARQSPRADDDRARNIWELAAWAVRSPEAVGDEAPPERLPLWDASAGGSHMQRVYQFSIGPWRWLELLWPNFGGRQFPLHQRWLSAVEGERRIWAPSLYAGALTLPLALGGWRRARGPRWRWMKWLAVGAALASLGEYGLGWALGGAMQWTTGRTLPAGPEVGGVYWLMNTLLPGYVAFRYPAKLWTITALAVAMLSAQGWQDATRGEDPAAVNRLKWVSLLGLAGTIVVLVARAWLLTWFGMAPADPLFGPLDVSGAWADLALAFATGAIVCFVGWRLLQPGRAQRPWMSIALFALAALDLGMAHRWLAPCADASAWRTKPAFDPPPAAGPAQTRIYRDAHWLPNAWRETGSPDRLREMLVWERNTLLPKYHLPLKLGSVESSGMMIPDDFAAFWEVARRHGPERPDAVSLPHRSALDLAGAEYLVLPGDARYDSTTLVRPAPATISPVADAALWQNEQACPRAWIVHQVEQLPPLEDGRPAAIRQRTEDVLFPAGKPRDWRREAVIETSAPTLSLGDSERQSGNVPQSNDAAQVENESAEFCRVLSATPRRVTLAARLARPGLIVLGDSYYPGWRATFVAADSARREAEILRTNRLLRGVMAPAGDFRLEFSYDPRSVYWGLAISGLAWSGFAVAAAWGLAARTLTPRRS